MSRQISLAGSSVILFEGVADQVAHVAAQIIIDQADEWRCHHEDQAVVTVGSASMLKFACKAAGKILSFMLFWIGGGDVRAAAIAIISIVSGTIRNEINSFFPAGIVPEFLEFL